ncbi:MAG TPA: glycine zipper domain-containing protein [Planctomycetota bacterium]|nr:glycine zipper domain-containing protein [Planctomycetota bacterium]
MTITGWAPSRLTFAACAAALLCGCAQRPQSILQPIPPPQVKADQPDVTYSYEHKLDPEPGYEPRSDIDALAAQLSGVIRTRSRAPRIVAVRSYTVRPVGVYGYGYGYGHGRGRSTRGLSGYHYMNTLFWGGLGAAIGHQSGHTAEGAIIGAAAGHTIDHGGLHGLLSRDTIFGGAVGAGIGSFSGRAGKGALIGAAAGHLLDDVWRSQDDEW